jgi:N-acetylmuramoyl-L-alanine amidase
VNSLRIHSAHLSYVPRLERRTIDSIDLAVIHCTELPDLATARQYGEAIHYPESRTGNSGHYYIEQNGRVEQWAPPDRIAHHVRDHNRRSIGIELDNPGRYPEWFDSRRQTMTADYPDRQLESLVMLLNHLCDRLPALGWICGHESLDTSKVPATDNPEKLVFRKRDPGPRFPWPDVLSATRLKALAD